MKNIYPSKFYLDLASWLRQWLIENVGKEHNKLPYEINLRMVSVVVIKTFYSYIKTLYCRAPVSETAGIFEVSDDTVSRAIKKDFS